VGLGPAFAEEYDRLIFDAQMRDYFGPSGYYNAGYWGSGASTPTEAAEALTDRMIDTLPEAVPEIADIGCGLGATTLRLSQRRPGSRITAINFSRTQLDTVGQRCPGAVLVHADAARTGLDPSSFDAILSVEAALHFQTRIDFFHEAFRLLKSGGALAMTDILFAESGWPGSWTVPEENYLASPAEYRAALEAAGFVDVAIEDALDACWGGFCRGLERWSSQKPSSEEDAEKFRAYIAHMLSGTTHYLLVSARKPTA
jgi:cyclopropane fatty-acyl-phospholipid synthase-like methyltransferase